MLFIAGSICLAFSPHRLRLFLAEQVPAQLRTRDSLLYPSHRVAYTGLALLLGGLLLLRLITGDSWEYSPAWIPTLMLLGLGGYLFWCVDGVYGAGRAKTLRYAYYAGQPEFRQPGGRRAILVLDQAETLAQDRQRLAGAGASRLLSWWASLSIAILLLGGLLLLVFAGLSGATRLVLLLVLVAAAAWAGLRWARWQRFRREQSAVVSSEVLRDIVSQAHERYPEPAAS